MTVYSELRAAGIRVGVFENLSTRHFRCWIKWDLYWERDVLYTGPLSQRDAFGNVIHIKPSCFRPEFSLRMYTWISHNLSYTEKSKHIFKKQYMKGANVNKDLLVSLPRGTRYGPGDTPLVPISCTYELLPSTMVNWSTIESRARFHRELSYNWLFSSIGSHLILEVSLKT